MYAYVHPVSPYCISAENKTSLLRVVSHGNTWQRTRCWFQVCGVEPNVNNSFCVNCSALSLKSTVYRVTVFYEALHTIQWSAPSSDKHGCLMTNVMTTFTPVTDQNMLVGGADSAKLGQTNRARTQ